MDVDGANAVPYLSSSLILFYCIYHLILIVFSDRSCIAILFVYSNLSCIYLFYFHSQIVHTCYGYNVVMMS